MTHHQQVTLNTVAPETEYNNLKSKELSTVHKYNDCNSNTMLAENETFKVYIIMNGGLE